MKTVVGPVLTIAMDVVVLSDLEGSAGISLQECGAAAAAEALPVMKSDAVLEVSASLAQLSAERT